MFGVSRVSLVEGRNFVQDHFGGILFVVVNHGAELFGVENHDGFVSLALERRRENQRLAVSKPAKSPDAAITPRLLQLFIGIADVQ